MSKAMVIDDSRAIRMILGRLLEARGFEVITAGNGKEAIDLVQVEGDDLELILVDWNMPVMNGLEFVKALRSDSLYDSVRVMMVTTETDTEQMIQALEAGANEYVMKPFSEDMITDKLRMLGIETGSVAPAVC